MANPTEEQKMILMSQIFDTSFYKKQNGLTTTH